MNRTPLKYVQPHVMGPAWATIFVGLVTACSARPAPPAAQVARVGPTQAAPRDSGAADCIEHPASPPEPTSEVIHGVEVRDPFRWLEDAKSDRVKQWVDAQDAFARKSLASFGVHAQIVGELEALRAEPRWTKMPVLRGGRYLYGRLAPNAERSTIYEYDPRSGGERVVLDLSQVDPAPKFWVPSPDGARIAILTSPNAGDALVARVYDVRAAKWLPDVVPGLRWSFPSWTSDAAGFYYTWSPTAAALTAGKRASESQIRFHLLGEDPAHDEVVRQSSGIDGAYEVPGISPDGNWLVAMRLSGSSATSLFLGRTRRRSSVDHWIEMTPPGGHSYYALSFSRHDLVVLTDEGAPHRRAFRVDPSRPDRAHWVEIVPERANATLDDVTAVGDYLVFECLQDAETYFEVRRADGRLVKEVRGPVGGALGSFVGQANSGEGSVALSTYTQPYQVYTLRPPSFELVPFPPGFEGVADDGYVTEKVFYTSSDGTRAPIFVVHKRWAARRSAPLMLYAYGAFGESTLPAYHRDIRVWLDRGGTYAEAIVRGGGEYGKDWHLAGMGKNRKNVYDDFLAASELLVRDGWTTSEQLVIRGVSAGGLLVTVAETERPSLFKAVIAEVPIADMVRYPLGHDSGTLWTEEYGSPSKPDEFEVLYRYSPYHRIRRGTRYPMTLIVASENDERLDPMHGRKLAAALDDADPCATVYLRTEREGGHGGSSRASSWMQESADIYTFALQAVGLAR